MQDIVTGESPAITLLQLQLQRSTYGPLTPVVTCTQAVQVNVGGTLFALTRGDAVELVTRGGPGNLSILVLTTKQGYTERLSRATRQTHSVHFTGDACLKTTWKVALNDNEYIPLATSVSSV